MLDRLFVDPTINPYIFSTSSNELYNKVKITNLGRSGTTTGGFLPSLHHMLKNLYPPPTAIFVDFSINDAFVRLEEVRFANEALIRYLRREQSQSEIFFIEALCSHRAKESAQIHLKLAEYYDIPLISFRSAVGGGKSCERKEIWGIFKNAHTNAHPLYYVHQNIAWSVVKGLFHFVKKECLRKDGKVEDDRKYKLPSKTMFDKEKLKDFEVCNPISYYDANEMFNNKNKNDQIGKLGEGIISKGWELREDRRGKAGWISSKRGNIIEFNVTFGTNPRLIVGFLKSYEKIGDATMTFPNINSKANKVDLIGLDEMSHSSQTYPYVTVPLKNIKGKDFPAINTTTIIQFKSTSSKKFKILYVVSC